MSAPWMEHPKLIAWFDDLEDAVATALLLAEEERTGIKARRAPRADTWVIFALDREMRDHLRLRLADVQRVSAVPLAADCHVLTATAGFEAEEDTFERDNGFSAVDVEYVEEGSAADVRRELLSDACDYAASDEVGWFYGVMDGEYDFEGNEEGADDLMS